jgi:hypothetical protein
VKGVIFNLLEEVVVATYGDKTWDSLLEDAGVSGAYTSLGSYPDEEVGQLVAAASRSLGIPASDILRWFGRQAVPLLAEKYGHFFEKHDSALSFILSVNTIIHPEVRKLYAGAHCPAFHFRQSPDGTLMMSYDSPRKLCSLRGLQRKPSPKTACATFTTGSNSFSFW